MVSARQNKPLILKKENRILSEQRLKSEIIEDDPAPFIENKEAMLL